MNESGSRRGKRPINRFFGPGGLGLAEVKAAFMISFAQAVCTIIPATENILFYSSRRAKYIVRRRSQSPDVIHSDPRPPIYLARYKINWDFDSKRRKLASKAL